MEPFAQEVWPKPKQVEGAGDVACGCQSPQASQRLVGGGQRPPLGPGEARVWSLCPR